LTEPDPRAPLPARTGPPRLAVSGRVGPGEASSLCACVRASVGGAGPGPIACDVSGIEDPDVGTVDALARMALAARRLGREMELQRTEHELVELLELAGLVGLAVEVVREPEEREEPSGVEEEGDPADPVA
jgi:ABC-type transporter Mla MlaB component